MINYSGSKCNKEVPVLIRWTHAEIVWLVTNIPVGRGKEELFNGSRKYNCFVCKQSESEIQLNSKFQQNQW